MSGHRRGRLTPGAFAGLVPAVLGVWAALYLVMMWKTGWPWSSRSILATGTIPLDAFDRFGATVPVRIHQGQWQRVITGLGLHGSLLSLILLSWWWAGLAKTLKPLVGSWHVLALMVFGGAAGGAAHVWLHPTLHVPAPGPLLVVVALIGAQLAFAVVARHPRSKALLISSIMSVIILAAWQWFGMDQAGITDWQHPALGAVAMLASLAAGFVGMVLLRPWRQKAEGEHQGMRGYLIGALVLGVVAWGAFRQVTAIAASDPGSRTALHMDLRTVYFAERSARRVYEQGLAARRSERNALGERLRKMRRVASDLDAPDSKRLLDYVDAMQAIADGDVPDPSIVVARCRRALKRWYDESEAPMRAAAGLNPRPAEQLRTWDRP